MREFNEFDTVYLKRFFEIRASAHSKTVSYCAVTTRCRKPRALSRPRWRSERHNQGPRFSTARSNLVSVTNYYIVSLDVSLGVSLNQQYKSNPSNLTHSLEMLSNALRSLDSFVQFLIQRCFKLGQL